MKTVSFSHLWDGNQNGKWAKIQRERFSTNIVNAVEDTLLRLDVDLPHAKDYRWIYEGHGLRLFSHGIFILNLTMEFNKISNYKLNDTPTQESDLFSGGISLVIVRPLKIFSTQC